MASEFEDFIRESWAKIRIPGNNRLITHLFGQFGKIFPSVYSNSPRYRSVNSSKPREIFSRIARINVYLVDNIQRCRIQYLIGENFVGEK